MDLHCILHFRYSIHFKVDYEYCEYCMYIKLSIYAFVCHIILNSTREMITHFIHMSRETFTHFLYVAREDYAPF